MGKGNGNCEFESKFNKKAAAHWESLGSKRPSCKFKGATTRPSPRTRSRTSTAGGLARPRRPSSQRRRLRRRTTRTARCLPAQLRLLQGETSSRTSRRLACSPWSTSRGVSVTSRTLTRRSTTCSAWTLRRPRAQEGAGPAQGGPVRPGNYFIIYMEVFEEK